LSTDFSHRNLRAIADRCGQHAAECRNIDRDEDWNLEQGWTRPPGRLRLLYPQPAWLPWGGTTRNCLA